MPYYVVKASKSSVLHYPIAAHFESEKVALDAIKKKFEDDIELDIKEIRKDVFESAFGDLPKGAFVSRYDYEWWKEE